MSIRLFSLSLLFVIATAVCPDGAARESRSGKQSTTKETRTGIASYYGPGLEGKKTASGEVFDKTEMVGAHPTYPFGTRVRVTNLSNGRVVDVRIADRGPTPENQKRGVIIDLSEQAAVKLGFRGKGTTRVKVEVLQWGQKDRQETGRSIPAG